MFLKTLICGTAGLAAVGSSYFYLNNEKMNRAPEREGKILLDAHAHPADGKDVIKTLEMLCSPGIVGLTAVNNPGSHILTYEKVVSKFPTVTEIDLGQLAKIESRFGTGYFMRTQEFINGVHDILAIGFEGDYMPNYDDPRKAIEEIHKRNGVAILCHPGSVRVLEAKLVRFRVAQHGVEERYLRELYEMADEVEVFNAQNINPTLGILVPNMKLANDYAEGIIDWYNETHTNQRKGIVSSDTHNSLDQPKICGIYLDKQDLCMEKIKEDIKTGNFDNDFRKYVSRLSFIKGMFLK